MYARPHHWVHRVNGKHRAKDSFPLRHISMKYEHALTERAIGQDYTWLSCRHPALIIKSDIIKIMQMDTVCLNEASEQDRIQQIT